LILKILECANYKNLIKYEEEEEEEWEHLATI
jgi:hypothetical protein